MARHIAWVVAVVLLAPGVGRAADLNLSCDWLQAAQQRGGHPPDKADKPGRPDQGHPSQKWWIEPKLRAELGITDQQSAAVDQVWQKSLPALRDARERLEKLEDSLSVMTASAADESAVIGQIEKVENTRAELNKGRTLMIYRMNKLLTADQRAKVKAMFDRREPSRRGPSSNR
jgi:Spy/CpxP family protein refolding chaperone